jgi:hypothetical protein
MKSPNGFDLGGRSWRFTPSAVFPLILASVLMAEPGPVWSGGIVTSCTETNLRAAMAGGGTVTFACDGTITLANTISNGVNIVLDGSGHQITISGGNAVRLFLVNTNTYFALTNLSLANGYSPCGSAILDLGGFVGLEGVAFSMNTAFPDYSSSSSQFTPGSGGAIFNAGGTVMADECCFTNNSAATSEQVSTFQTLHFLASGGAIYNQGQMNLVACRLAGNTAAGGSSFLQSMYGTGDPGYGGAVDNEGTLTLDRCTFSGNSASGGASFGDPTGMPGASAAGGAINNGGTLTITRSTFDDNCAGGGSGGTGLDSSNPNNPNGFPGGAGGSASGGAVASPGWLSVSASTFFSNAVAGASGSSGGSGRQTAPDMGGSGAAGGAAGSAVGGAVCAGGMASLINCTIAFNTGRGGNGGMGGSGAPSVMGSSGGNGGNGGEGVGGTEACNLTNCTLAGNVGIGGMGAPGGASFLPGGTGGPGGANGVNGSAVGATDAGTLFNTLIACTTPAGPDTFADPELGPLTNNGGPTMTMALLPGSPAIDAGTSAGAPATDQRGVPRPQGRGVDIGAFEYQYLPAFTGLTIQGLTNCQLQMFGLLSSNQCFALQASTNLLTWFDLTNWAVAPNGAFQFVEPVPAKCPARFYRLTTGMP